MFGPGVAVNTARTCRAAMWAVRGAGAGAGSLKHTRGHFCDDDSEEVQRTLSRSIGQQITYTNSYLWQTDNGNFVVHPNSLLQYTLAQLYVPAR